MAPEEVSAFVCCQFIHMRVRALVAVKWLPSRVWIMKKNLHHGNISMNTFLQFSVIWTEFSWGYCSRRQGENIWNQTSLSKACALPSVQHFFFVVVVDWRKDNCLTIYHSLKPDSKIPITVSSLHVFFLKNYKYYLDFQFSFPEFLYFCGKICLPSCSVPAEKWSKRKLLKTYVARIAWGEQPVLYKPQAIDKLIVCLC